MNECLNSLNMPGIVRIHLKGLYTNLAPHGLYTTLASHSLYTTLAAHCGLYTILASCGWWYFNMTCIQICQPSFCSYLVRTTQWWYLHTTSHTYKSLLTKFWLSFVTSLPVVLHRPAPSTLHLLEWHSSTWWYRELSRSRHPNWAEEPATTANQTRMCLFLTSHPFERRSGHQNIDYPEVS